MAENETDGLEKFVQWLSSLRTKFLYGGWALLSLLWVTGVQWLSPKIATLTPINKLLLQLLGASWLLLAAVSLSCLILWFKKKEMAKTTTYPVICGLKWDTYGQALCPQCENPLFEAAYGEMGCAFCKVSTSPNEHGHNVGIEHAVKVARERLNLPKL